MIDEKKIIEAAIKNADKYNPCRSTLDMEEVCRASFEDGAKWFRNALWHPASEKPTMSEHGMIIVELNDITSCKYSLWRSTTTYECLCNNKGYVRRWLYLDDLLEKGGEK